MSDADVKALAREVLTDAFVMSLGTQDEAGVWVSDVIYIHDDDFTLYWVSFPHVRHSKAIDEDGVVACTVTASWTPGDERALQIGGVAEQIQGEMPDLVSRLYAKCGTSLPARSRNILEEGRVWYRLRPQVIELHYGTIFGYEKQRVAL